MTNKTARGPEMERRNSPAGICWGIGALVLGLLLTAARADYPPEDSSPVHSETLSLAGIETLSVNYGEGAVILRESESDELTLREYLDRDNPRYFCRVSRSPESLQISRGDRPWFWSWFEDTENPRLEIFLPRSFRGNLRFSCSSGSITGETDLLDYRSLDITLSSGSVALNKVSGESVSIHVSSGKLEINSVEGNSFISVSSGRLRFGSLGGEENRVKVSSGRLWIGELEGRGIFDVDSGNLNLDRNRGGLELDLTSGQVELADFSGGGIFAVRSGNLRVSLRDLEEDLNFRLSSGTVNLSVPPDLSFYLDAVTGSGTVRVNEEGRDTIRSSGNSTILRPLGPSPERTIFVRTSSGVLDIKRRGD